MSTESFKGCSDNGTTNPLPLGERRVRVSGLLILIFEASPYRLRLRAIALALRAGSRFARPSPGAPASIKLSRRPLPEGEGPLPNFFTAHRPRLQWHLARFCDTLLTQEGRRSARPNDQRVRQRDRFRRRGSAV